MSKIKEIFRKKEERRTKLQRSLNSIRDRLKDMEAQKIILVGGDVGVNSDLDLFVLIPSTKTGRR